MRKKLPLLALLCIAVVAALLLGARYWNADQRHMAQALELDTLPSTADVLTYTDTHGGFHGDGEAYGVVKFEQSITDQLTDHWHTGQPTENISLAIYGGERDGITYGSCKQDIPQKETGYWYFQDRSTQAQDPYSDQALLDRSSQNFTFAFYDVEEDTLYFYELDT